MTIHGGKTKNGNHKRELMNNSWEVMRIMGIYERFMGIYENSWSFHVWELAVNH